MAATIRDEDSSLDDDDRNSSDVGDDLMLSSSSDCGGGLRTYTARSRAWKPPVASENQIEYKRQQQQQEQQQQQRMKRYKRAKEDNANVKSAVISQPPVQHKTSPTKRRILRKDRRATLELLTSDDDVNEYHGIRPSPYIEPAARKTLHEVKPHWKSSYETLYNPEFNQFYEDPELYSSCESALGDDKKMRLGVVNPTETWNLVSGPKVSSPYLRAAQTLEVSNENREGMDIVRLPSGRQFDQLDKRDNSKKPDLSDHQQNIRDKIWTEFGRQEMRQATPSNEAVTIAKDSEWIMATEYRKSSSQPLNVSITVSKPNESLSNTPASTSIGVDLKIKLGKPAVANAPSSSSPTTLRAVTMKGDAPDGIEKSGGSYELAKLPSRLLLPDKASPRIATSPAPDCSPIAGNHRSLAVEKLRGRRVLPTVPDSADLEVSDLLRETKPIATTAETATTTTTETATARPKSAVDILVPKSRSSSILQMKSQSDERSPSTVSQQLRSLFHNPSPQIMLHRAATRPTMPAPPQALAKEDTSAEFLHQRQANKYLPLRGSHNRVDEVRRSENNGSAITGTSSNFQLGGSQLPEHKAAQAPELPLRRNRSLLPSQHSQQEPPRSQSAAMAYKLQPPTVPPRQAKTTVARQQSPSTFYPSKVQLVVNRNSGPAAVVSNMHELRDPEHGADLNGKGLHSVDQLCKKVLLSPDQSTKHRVIVDKSVELNGNCCNSGEYMLAGDASVACSLRMPQTVAPPNIPSRIKTNPHAGSRNRDSITRRGEPSDDRSAEHISKLHDPSLNPMWNLAGRVSRDEENLLTSTSALTVGQGRVTSVEPYNVVTVDPSRHRLASRRNQSNASKPQVTTKELEGSELRQSQPGIQRTTDGQPAVQATARDRLFSVEARSSKPHGTIDTQPAVKSAMINRLAASPNVTKPPDNSQIGKEVRMPPNAVRVLPREENSELRQRLRSLRRSPRPAEDAVAGLERMCRDMQLDDDGLLDGAERHDTPMRVQVRMDSLSAKGPQQSSAASESTTFRDSAVPIQRRPYFVQHRGIFPLNREKDDQARRTQADLNRKYNAATRSESYLRMVRQTGASESGKSHHRQQQQQQRHIQSGGIPILQPGECEEGPEVIL